MAQSLETPPEPLVIVQSAIVRDVVESGDLLAVGVYNIGSMTSPASHTGATFQARLVSGQGDLPGVATLAPFYDLATTSVDLSGTPDGWGIRDVPRVQASVRRRSRERDCDDHAAGRRLGLFRLDGRTELRYGHLVRRAA